MSVGEVVVRHLWCCVAHDAPAGSCEGMPVAIDPQRVGPALQSLPAAVRHDVYAFARMGPDPKHPYTGLCDLALRRGMRPKDLRERAISGAQVLTGLLCG